MTGATSQRRRLPVASGRRVARHTGHMLRRRWLPLTGATVATIVQAAAALGVPAVIGWITQLVVDRAAPAALIAPIVVLAGCAVLGAASTWLSGRLLASAVLPPLGELREEVVSAAVRLPLDTVEDGGEGDLVSRVSDDVEQVTEVAQGTLGSMLSAGIAIAVTLVGLAGLDWRFAVAALLAVPVQGFTLRWYLRVSGPLYAEGRFSAGRRTARLLESFSALPTIRAFGLRGRQQRLAAEASADTVGYELKATRMMTRFYGRLNLAELIGLSAILVVAFALVGAGEVSVGAATAAALFFAGLFNPINTVLGVFDDMQRAGAGLARLIGVVDAGAAAGQTAAAASPANRQRAQEPSTPPALSARSLTFGYTDSADLIRNLDLTVRPGARVAVVGASGSGKSTLASLLAGVRHPRGGVVEYGGLPLGGLDADARGRIVALVAQETHVFAGTVADNLRLARPAATDDELRDALAAVGSLSWVDALPHGMETLVGAGGRALSPLLGQHLALARVHLLDPVFVILDEATADAGSDAAHSLDAAAEAVLDGRGALIVAHRLSQAETADRILVMDAGRVMESGSHDELVAAGGQYARLWNAWATVQD